MPIGPYLLARGVLSEASLAEATQAQRASGERLDRVLVRLGLASPDDVLAALGEQFQLAIVDLDTVEPEPDALAALPPGVVFAKRCVPIRRLDGVLTIATSDPTDLSAIDDLRHLARGPTEVVLADDESVTRFIRKHYGVAGDTLDALGGQAPALAPGAHPEADEAGQAQDASVIRLVSDLLTEAVEQRATDVHIEPYERDLVVRYRIDGVLERANVPPSIMRFGAAIVSRLKIMASLNIAEKRRPQDGRILFRHRKAAGEPVREFDLRVSIIPMLFGEGVVLRVLSKAAAVMSLPDLGMPAGVRDSWERLIARPHGVLLVTGPTGSGKSTTLYASLNQIVSDAVKVVTVEDPVEYHVAGVNQIPVNAKVGLSFAEGLRAILRHDPDVVMIGEIRDRETAEVAVQASLTGHLVFSTLHTNDAPGAVTRLIDMGVEPFLVASSLEGVLAQRLVRRVCAECAQWHDPHPAELPAGFTLAPGERLRRGRGCRACRLTGYKGRVGVYELMGLPEPVREAVNRRASAPEVAAAALAAGALSRLLDDGLAKVRAGATTPDEVLSAMSE